MEWLGVEAPDPDGTGGLRSRQPHGWSAAGTVMTLLLVAVACFGVGEAMIRKGSVEERAAPSTTSDADPVSKFATAFVPSLVNLQRANTNMNQVNGQVFAASTITMAHHVQKKATKHHEHSRPRKSRASDRNRTPPSYPAMPDIPWMTVTSLASDRIPDSLTGQTFPASPTIVGIPDITDNPVDSLSGQKLTTDNVPMASVDVEDKLQDEVIPPVVV